MGESVFLQIVADETPMTKTKKANRVSKGEKANVPFSTPIPQYVKDHLTKMAGVGTAAAMARKVLTDWAEANGGTR